MLTTDDGQKAITKMVEIAAILGAQGYVVNIMTDRLAGVRINGPVVLVTYPGNTMI